MPTEIAEEPAVTSRADRREAQRLATREKLLEVSVAEFQRTGFGQTDIATIVEQAGVSRGTFYFHFRTKDDVLAELRMREERHIVQEVSPRLARDEPLETVLGAVVGGILHAEDRLGADLVREICAVQFRPSVADSDTVADHPVAELVLRAVADSSKPMPESHDLAVIFLVAVFGLLSAHRGPSDDRDRLIDALINLTVKGVSRP
ncbi:MAG TPA: TetR/AcrR family transcriptional regulator [Acidimicrobiales bacterium]|nr:TetR/AcrR family transcriptional regulator [Acidimicrobiales bacterium]